MDAKDLFHLYIVVWLEDKRLNLLDMCKPEKLRWTGITTPHGTSPFVEEMYERIRETLNEYHTLLDRWPEYAIPLERVSQCFFIYKSVLELLDNKSTSDQKERLGSPLSKQSNLNKKSACLRWCRSYFETCRVFIEEQDNTFL